jgi:hypothetical protein
VVFQCADEWPAVWPWTDRKKYLSQDRTQLFRFDGLAHYGNTVRRRSQLLAERGWGPATESAGNGFTVFPWLCCAGFTPGSRDQKRKALLAQLAQYCAFRALHFETEVREQAALERMARLNLQRALDVDLPDDFRLPIERPVIADARIMPHEWIAAGDGRLLKCDASSHGDDHFLPGPTDIAWDLAGAIVEWDLDREQTRAFLDEYRRASRDNPDPRLADYLIAYCAFRLGFSLSAGQSVHDAAEKHRFERAAQCYKERILSLLCLSTAA